LHRRRHDLTVSVHNHPRYATIWANHKRVPPVYDQTSSLIDHGRRKRISSSPGKSDSIVSA